MTGPVQLGHSSRRRGDCGLTTLEWLLITAAVAALAALAVVLVQGEVEDTAQQLSDPDALQTVTLVTAFEVERDAKAAAADDFETWADWERGFSEECNLIAVLYARAGVEVVHNNFDRAVGGTAFDAAAADHAAAADEQPATAAKARAQCQVR